jgi:hypothetical protein
VNGLIQGTMNRAGLQLLKAAFAPMSRSAYVSADQK